MARLPKIPAPPSPAEVISEVADFLRPFPKPARGPIFDAKDFAGFAVLFGDANRDKRVDVRGVVLGRGPAGIVPLMVIGPHNVPVTEALETAHAMVALLPPAVQPEAYAAIGATAGASKMLEAALVGGE